MNYEHNIFLRVLTERSLATFIGIFIASVFLYLPFFIGFVIVLIVAGGFFILITATEQPGILTNIIIFFFCLSIMSGTTYKLVNYEAYFKQGNVDLNKSYVYSDGSEGKFEISVLEGNKIKYSFTTKDETILLRKTLDINITETDFWYDQTGDTNYKIMGK